MRGDYHNLFGLRSLVFEHPGNEWYLSKYLSVSCKSYCFDETLIMNKSFIIFVFMTQWSADLHKKIKSYAGAKWHGKLQTTFWDGCIHKDTFRDGMIGGRKAIFYISAYLLKTPSCKHRPLRQVLRQMGVLFQGCWLIHIVMSVFLTRVWTYCSFFPRGITQEGRGGSEIQGKQREKWTGRKSLSFLSRVGDSAVRNLAKKEPVSPA